MDYHNLNIKEVFKDLNTSEKGLTDAEAESRLKKSGFNEINEIRGKSKLKLFLSQFNSLLIYILIIAAVISIAIGHNLDGIVISIIILLDGIIGFLQEYKAEKIIEKLKKSLEYKILVFRNNKQKEIDSKFLVPGDIISLDEGDKILADCRIIKQNNLFVNESVLTGESFPIEKSSNILDKMTILSERTNMLFAGTSIARGNCLAVVVHTGKETEFGKIAELVQTTLEEQMPLEKKMNAFSKKISIAILAFVTCLFFIGIKLGKPKIEMFLIAVSLAVSAIPEGLPAIVAITLAVAINRMRNSNTLVRKLPAAETLGRATVICTDKTGTLTEEKLNVDKVYAGKFYSINALNKRSKSLECLFKIGILCNNARGESGDILGDPTEVALIKSANIFGLDKIKETNENIRLKEYTFSSERKLMSIVRENAGIKTSYVKGAPIFILEKCTKEFIEGKIKLLDNKRKAELKKICIEMENQGLRVLGFAFRDIAGSKITQENAENNLVFSGFQGMIDPPRPEIKNAIHQALEAGIQIKILTGDSALTTKAIAEKIGLNGEIIEGDEIENLDEDNLYRVVKENVIFARITPKQKLKIVEILKKQNHIVAVTGDGVNDILALKKADIGISMGIRGTDVARDSSDMVLLDDNFASIINAVKEGRRIYDNLKKSIKFLFAANVGEIFIVFFALVFQYPLPFLPLAILWMNLVTDSLPALALAVEPCEEDIMKNNQKIDGLLDGIWHWIIVAGILGFLSSFLVFNYALKNNYSLEIARTMATTTAIFFELFFIFSCKSEKSLFKTGIFNNKLLIYSVIISIGLHMLVVYSSISKIFGFTALGFNQLGIAILSSLSGLILFESWKLIK
ncbi:MAG: cation-translocating P-type ATPase [Nanoarchaeota archaeon]